MKKNDLHDFAKELYALDFEPRFGTFSSPDIPIMELNVWLKKKDAETGRYNSRAAMLGCRVLPCIGSGIYEQFTWKDQGALAASIDTEASELFESMVIRKLPYPRTGPFREEIVSSEGSRPAYSSPDLYTTVLVNQFMYDSPYGLNAFLEYYDYVIAKTFPNDNTSKGLVTAIFLWAHDTFAANMFRNAGWNILQVHVPFIDALMDAYGHEGPLPPPDEVEPKLVSALVCACRVIDY